MVTVLIGCRGSEPLTLFSRKSLKQQQREAEYFDPLPSPDAGPNPPGLRLKGMEIPAPEPVRAVAEPIHAFEYVEDENGSATAPTYYATPPR